ncbi:hypothetical protein FACS1894216_09340 [Synergistales bacterium]|nr:hypothetical protein FACS1894216_09340 [Synergistales bacterium]
MADDILILKDKTAVLIGDGEFSGRADIAVSSLPDTVMSIGEAAFFRCGELALASLPGSLSSVGAWAFRDCAKMPLSSLPRKLLSIGEGAFSGCASLALTELPEVAGIEDYTFSGCAALPIKVLPSSAEYIGEAAFSGCASITRLDMSGCSKLKRIGDNAFAGCASLTEVIMPPEPPVIGTGAFSGTSPVFIVSGAAYAGWTAPAGTLMKKAEQVYNTKETTTAKEGMYVNSALNFPDGPTLDLGDPVKRQLHFFWLIDCSASMRGKKIETLNQAIREAVPAVRMAAESRPVNVLMRAIKFSTVAQWHVGPGAVPIDNFVWQPIEAGGNTSTAKAIDLLCGELAVDKMRKKAVPPVCVLISDGFCTDTEEEFAKAIKKINSIPWGKKAIRLVIAIGDDDSYDENALLKFCNQPDTGVLKADSPEKLVEYIRWASTIATMTASDTKNSVVTLPPDISISDVNDTF